MAGNLSKWEVAQFKEAFALFDLKKIGSIDDKDLFEMMAKLGQECTEEEIKNMIDEVDELGTGRINFPSFLKQFQHDENKPDDEFLKEAFEIVGGGDKIRIDHLKEFFGKTKLKLIDDEFEEIVKTCDKDGDGVIGLDDFKEIFLKR